MKDKYARIKLPITDRIHEIVISGVSLVLFLVLSVIFGIILFKLLPHEHILALQIIFLILFFSLLMLTLYSWVGLYRGVKGYAKVRTKDSLKKRKYIWLRRIVLWTIMVAVMLLAYVIYTSLFTTGL